MKASTRQDDQTRVGRVVAQKRPDVSLRRNATVVAAVVAVCQLLASGTALPAGTKKEGQIPQGSQAPAAASETSLTLSAAAVTVTFPAGQAQWGRLLAGYADAAAAFYRRLLGKPVPAGRLRWRPVATTADTTTGGVDIERQTGPLTLSFHDSFSLLASDHGVAYATGYARWLTSYAVARLYWTDQRPTATATWVADGAALYLTDLLSRQEHATTPLLYGLEAAYVRAVRGGQPVLPGAAESSDNSEATRGKAYLTFRLLEALYGGSRVAAALRATSMPTTRGFSAVAVIAAAFSGELQPDPGAVLATWLEPNATIDLGLAKVKIDRQGRRLSGQVTRKSEIPVPVHLEIRLANGGLVPLDFAAGTAAVHWETTLQDEPVEVRLDPAALLPDINRGNNRYGFGSAAPIKNFFELDDIVRIGELHFDGHVEIVNGKRVEEFTVTLANLTKETIGLGLLVSAQWLDRPAERRQRAIFVNLPAGEQRLARDFLVYPRRGRGRARIEARYWRAADPQALTSRLLRDAADLVNSYLLIRAPAEANLTVAGAMSAPPEVVQVAELTVPTSASSGGATSMPFAPTSSAGAGASNSVAGEKKRSPLSVRILSPEDGALLVGELVFEVAVDAAGNQVGEVEFYINDRLLQSRSRPPYRMVWTPAEGENLFVLRALALGTSGQVATATRVLKRGAPGFGATVDLVTLHATVRGEDGQYVRGLQPADFQVIEDGVAQEISQFAHGETPVSVALLLDTSSSMIGGGIASARSGARHLVQAVLHGRDRAMILGFNDRLYLYSDFTNDMAALEEGIAATYPDGNTALFDAIVSSLRKINSRKGKRALALLSDGLDTHSRFRFADVLEYTRQSDVLVYTIGLQLMHDATALADASGAVRESVEHLRSLAEVTGGAAYFPLRLAELEEVYGQIADELESQYALSYYPINQSWDGRWRRVKVLLPHQPQSQVQVRPGYYGVRPEHRSTISPRQRR
ncbi:MAG: VWA domain-containing protein [Acidobacteriota bacterium]